MLDILEQTQKKEVTSQEVSELWNRSELEKQLEEGGFMKVQSPEMIELALKQAQDMAATAQMLDGKEHLLQRLHSNLRLSSAEVQIQPALPPTQLSLTLSNDVFYDAPNVMPLFPAFVAENTDTSSSGSYLDSELPQNVDKNQIQHYPAPEAIQCWKDQFEETFGLCGGCFWPSFPWKDQEGKKTKLYINGHECNAGICNVTGKTLNKNALKSYKRKAKRRKLIE